MLALKYIRLCVAGLLAGTALLHISHAASPAPAPDEEAAKQDAIYRSRGENRPVGYVVDRALLAYSSILSPAFDRALADLGPLDRWLDIGAGQGLAVLEYYTSRYDAMHPEGREQRGKKARAVAMSIEDRRTPRWHETAARLEADQIQYLFGRRLREYSSDRLGRFQLISDVMGGFAYTQYLSLFMEKVLDLLELNGNFFTLLVDVRQEQRTHRDYSAQLLTEIDDARGSAVGVCSWLKRIGCAKVTCESDAKSTRPTELYRIQKVCDHVTVPALTLVEYQAGTPPLRRFSARKPAPKSR